MGIFDVFKKDKNNNDDCISRVNLAKEQVDKICLEKKPLTNLKAQVGIVLDYSGSMETMYKDGTVQHLIEQIIPIAMQFDDNQKMECWLFSDSCHRLNDVTLKNLPNYVKNIPRHYRMNGTLYAPVIKSVTEIYNVSKTPAYVLFVTDGDCFDHNESEVAMEKAAHYPIFFQFVGLGKRSFSFLEHLDDMSGRYVDNADFFSVKNINDITYRDLLKEFPEWLEYDRVKQMLS